MTLDQGRSILQVFGRTQPKTTDGKSKCLMDFRRPNPISTWTKTTLTAWRLRWGPARESSQIRKRYMLLCGSFHEFSTRALSHLSGGKTLILREVNLRAG
ncbi:hypothetical protein GQ457_02G028360 [Hibiscus cannabinus]